MAKVSNTHKSDTEAKVKQRSRELPAYQARYHRAAESAPALPCLLLLHEALNASLLSFYKSGFPPLAAKFMPPEPAFWSCESSFVSSEDAECKEV